MKNSMKLTTLTRLESVTKFTEVEKVYEAAMVWASVINYAEDELAENAVVRLFRTTAK